MNAILVASGETAAPDSASTRPMLARSATIPGGHGWTFEPTLDGFRGLVCAHDGFRARSRRD